MTKYLNFFESESGFTEAVEADELFFPNVSYTEDDDTVHWNLAKPANPVETPMLRMHFSTSTPGQRVRLTRYSDSNVTAMEIDGTPVNVSGDTYSIAEPGNHTAVYQFASPKIPDYLFFVSSYPFSAFKSAEIISPVTSIGNLSFDRCTDISAVTIPDSVTSIGFQAFSSGDLTGVTIPDSVTTIGFGAFSHTGLRSITFPDSVTSMGHTCFISCTEMESARIGNGITALPDQTFAGCDSLQRVTLPDNLTSIGVEAFLSCHSLHSIDIPSGVTTIGERAFASCERLYDINIPSGVTTIGNEAFSRCSGLNAIYFNPETPPSLGAKALLDTNNCPIYVPAGSVDTYKEAWPGYASRIRPRYNISASVNDDSLGNVDLSQETASEGDTVDFIVNVFDSKTKGVTSLTITDGNGSEVEYTDERAFYSFTMPASDVTISVTIGEKPKHRISASVNDDSLGQINLDEETASEGERVHFNVDVFDSETKGVTSLTITDGNGSEVECDKDWDNHYSFTMPASNVTISVEIGDKIPEYNISASVNDDSLGWVNLSETAASEGAHVEFDVEVYDSDANQVSFVTVTDENGDEVEYTDEDYGGGTLHCTFTMPASDVTVFAMIKKKQ